MKRRPVIAGNWKMYITASQAETVVNRLKTELAGSGDVEIVLCPPFTTLPLLCSRLSGTGINVGAQNMHWQAEGAYTGEVSPPMLVDIGCSHVLLGHSERRSLFGETDSQVQRKLAAALEHGLVPILCVGETLAQREQEQTREVCHNQLTAALAELSPEQLARVIIAYEPVWAIGTGRTATPADAQAVIGYLRSVVAAQWSRVADEVRILYGGSVKPENIRGLMDEEDIDGALVGGASLDPGTFAQIVRFGE